MATVNHTFEVVVRAVPTQSLRARSKCESAPGAPAAVPVGSAIGRLWASAGDAPVTAGASNGSAARNATGRSRRLDDWVLGMLLLGPMGRV